MTSLGAFVSKMAIFRCSLAKRFDEGAARIFVFRQNAQSFAGTLANFGGIRPHEIRSAGKQFALHHGEVGGEMMPFHAPAPGARGVGFAEDGKIIQLAIAHHRAAWSFEFLEHGFEADDVGGLLIAVGAEP